jgi:hypothetical protein
MSGGAPVPAAGATWCHGAAGIAISRLRSAVLLRDPAVAADGAAALSETRATLRAGLTRAPRDLSLCHGEAGVADALIFAAQHTGDDGDRALATRAAERIARARATNPACGPGLFLGRAGTVLLCLRVHDPALPTPLAIHPRGP